MLHSWNKIARSSKGRRWFGVCSAFASVSTAIVVSACGGGSGNGGSGTPGNPSSTATGQVAVVNNRLQRNGAPWIPHGYFQVAFQVPPALANPPVFLANAQNYYTPQEYTDMANAKADSVRVMLGQPAGDPQNPYYSQAFVTQFINAVKSARAAGLTVIVGIQDESATGEQNPLYLPSAATQRVWAQLVPAFKDDKGILLELFNEPGTGPTQVPNATDWQNWANAMNATIASVRSEGATNVVIADGLAHAETLTGAPTLTDPLNQVAYAAHPYAFSASQETTGFWDSSFGNFSANAPVIITEWGQGYYCGPTDPQALVQFLSYLQTHGIGLEMGAWDWGGPSSFGTSRYNYPNAVFSEYENNGQLQTCGTPARGPGLTVNAWYTTGAVPANPL